MTTIASEKTVETEEQYSLAKILGIWAAVTIPAFILAWVVFPALTPDFETDPIGAGMVRMGVLTLYLIWDFVLALIIVYNEEGDLHWATLKRRLRLNTPLDPKTSQPRRKLWLWLIPIVLLHTVAGFIDTPRGRSFGVELAPIYRPPPGYELGSFLAIPGSSIPNERRLGDFGCIPRFDSLQHSR